MYSIDEYLCRALHWLWKSFEVTGYRGSSHSYSYWINSGNGWQRAYPETTGYILHTLSALYRSNDCREKNQLLPLIESQAQWLLNVQQPDGWIPEGKVPQRQYRPSVFNTSQVVLGWCKVWPLVDDKTLCEGIQRAVRWLWDCRDSDGAWRRYVWKGNGTYAPAYYTRALWAVALSIPLLSDLSLRNRIKRDLPASIAYYAQCVLPNGMFRDMGFQPEQKAFTHTLAYVMRGWVELAALGWNPQALDWVARTLDKLWRDYQDHGQLAGRYDERGHGDYSFRCVVGELQLAVVAYRMAELTFQQEFAKMGHAWFEYTIESLRQRGFLQGRKEHLSSLKWNDKVVPPRKVIRIRGVPGSLPLWGKYQPLRYPNWAVKFFIDACVLYKKLIES